METTATLDDAPSVVESFGCSVGSAGLEAEEGQGRNYLKSNLAFAEEYIDKRILFWANILWAYETKLDLFF